MSRRNIPIANNPFPHRRSLDLLLYTISMTISMISLQKRYYCTQRCSDRIEEEDFETVSRPYRGKNVLQKTKFSWIQISMTHLRHREKSRQDFLAVTHRGGRQLRSIGWKTYAWVVRSIEYGALDVRILRENVDWTTESIGSPEREAVKWWERWWCGDQVRQNLDREVPADGLMLPRDDRRGREDGGGPQVEKLCKRRSAKRGGRGGRLAAGGGVAQVPEGGRRGWPYRGFIVCVG